MKYITPEVQFNNRLDIHSALRQSHITPVNSPLYVITTHSNNFRYQANQRNYRRFEKMVYDAGAIPITVELTLRNRHHEVTSHTDCHHLQLRSPAELWHKENLINLGIQHVTHLYPDAEYFAWIDADVEFARSDWAVETIQQLQHYKLIQMFSHALDLVPDAQSPGHTYAPAGFQFKSFMYSYMTGGMHPIFPQLNQTPEKSDTGASGLGAYWHPGFAWAARRSALSDLGGLGDRAILGAADYYMAAGLVGAMDRVLSRNYSKDYKRYWFQWQERAKRHISVSDLGYMPGLLLHHYHGPKAKRQYQTREQIVADEHFEPSFDVKYDPQGVLEWEGNKPQLEVRVREYFRQRDEDALS